MTLDADDGLVARALGHAPRAAIMRDDLAGELVAWRRPLVGVRGTQQRALGEQRRGSCSPIGIGRVPPSGSTQPHGTESDGQARPATSGSCSNPSGTCCTDRSWRRTRTPGQRAPATRSGRSAEGALEISRDQRARLLRAYIICVVVAARERVRADQDPALHLGPESGGARLSYISRTSAPSTRRP